jgi:hypothetical protein
MRYLITLRIEPPDATLAHVQAALEPSGLTVDTDYGLVSISPKRGLYVVRADGNPEDADSAALAEEVVGVHGDVKIAPIEPVKAGREGD